MSPPAEPRGALSIGGAMASGLALLGAAALLGLYLASPSPILLVLEGLFALVGLAGGGLALWGALRGAPAGRRVGWLGVGLAAVIWLGVVPAAVVLGLPRFRAFQLRSRQAQAHHNLDRLRMGALSYRHGHGSFPGGDSGWVPEGPAEGSRYPVRVGTWAGDPWEALDFVPAAAHFHQYRVRALPDRSGLELSARGDLDGDGRPAVTTVVVREGPDGEVETVGPTRHPEDEY